MKLPPLRERREDIPYLTAAFVREIGERLQKPLQGLTPGAEARLTESAWDGNVRELRNVVERACILADGEFVTERELAVCLPPPGIDDRAVGRRRRAGRAAEGRARISSSTSNGITSSARWCGPAATRRPRRRCSA